jgi:proline iminopeptidase
MSDPERGLYPPVEPYESGHLDVGDGHSLYWEECGNPDGKPVVILHGGPGGGCSPAMRRFHDPDRYRIILFDQRGCGRSTPHASLPDADLSTNTTWHLVDDIERLREARGVDRWQVFGGSWGSALALAYAETHPEPVTELVLRGIFTLRRWELDWFYNGPAGLLQPEWWARFEAPLRERYGEASGLLVDGPDNIARYHDLLFDPDPAVHGPAGVAWSTWEAATVTLEPNPSFIREMSDPATGVAFARIENHYFVNAGWFREGQLIDEVGRIRHIPAVIVHGRYDVCCPARNAYDLAAAWPEAELRIVLAGHASYEPMIASELVAATDRFAS